MKKLNSSEYSGDSFDGMPKFSLEYQNNYTEGYYGAGTPETEKTLLRDFFATLLKHWLVIFAVILVITGLTIVYVAQKPDYYVSYARIQVNAENNPATGTRNGGNPIIVNNQGNDPAYFTTQLQVLEGSGLLRRVTKSLDLENSSNFLNPQKGKELTIWQNVRKLFGLYRPPIEPPTSLIPDNSKDNALKLKNDVSLSDTEKQTERFAPYLSVLKKNLVVSPVKDSRTKNAETRLIDIEFTHQDPAIAAKISNTIADLYVLQNLEQKIQTNASASDFLQKRVADLQSDIREGEERLINYAKNNQIISLDEKQNTVVQRFSDLNLKLGQAENDRISAQTAYQSAMQNQMRSTTAETRDPQVVGLETKLNDLNQRLAQLKTEYTDEWLEVIQTKKQIAGVEAQLSALRKRASGIQVSTLEERLNEATAREKILRNELNSQRGVVIKQNEAAINYNIIQQEIDTNKSLLSALLQRSRENDVVLNDTPNNVLVTDRAVISTAPAGPERTKNILLAFLVSLVMGCGLAFFLDWIDDSVKYADKLETELGLPLLAAIPAASLTIGQRLSRSSLSTRKHRMRKEAYNLTGFEKPAFLEAYVQLRTCLTLSTLGGPPQSILVTSAEEGEGKTVTAVNLALSLAKTGSRVLLIDADLRCPRIHLIKDLSNDAGLTNLLDRKDVDDETIENTIQLDHGGFLNILTAGDRAENPANLLCSEEMRGLLNKLSKTYAHIIIDSPPVLYFADSTIISTLVDSVLLVVRDNKSSTHTVLKAKKMLRSVGAKIIGMVINGVLWQKASYNNYSYYETHEETAPKGKHQILKLN
jgi:polysaccharide biosynthesis transport protein